MLLSDWKNVVRHWFSSSRRRRGSVPVVGIERLEVRSVMSASTPTVVAASALHSVDEIPQLDSNPDAFAQLYLDFNGNFESEWQGHLNVSSPAFSLDADPTTFSDWELATIREIWAVVTEDYAPFNVNVTTVEPTDFANGHALRVVIGGTPFDWHGGGVAGIGTHGGFTNGEPNVVYVFSDYGRRTRDEAISVADTVSHEAGHAFGLEHQAQFATNGVLVNCYRPGVNGVDPIMGGSGGSANRTTWSLGTSTSVMTIQDDLTVLASVLGYRADDAGGDVLSAAALPLENGHAAVDGLIERMSDVDAFRFHSDGGTTVFTVSPNLMGANLVLTAELRRLSGETVVRANSTDFSAAGLQAALVAGDYLLVVTSNGEYGSVGQYRVEGSINAAASTAPEAPTGLVAGSDYGYRHHLSWSAVTDASGYRVYRRPQDGQTADGTISTETLVATLPANATSVTMAVPRWPGQRFQDRWWADYRVEAFNSQGLATSGWQRVVHQFKFPLTTSAPRVTAVSATSVEVSWTPDSRAVGHVIQASEFVGQSSWTGHSSTTIAADKSHQTITGLTPGKRYRFEVNAFNEDGTRDLFYDFTMPHPQAPAAPSVQMNLLPGKVVNLTWDSVSGATGYYVSLLDDRGTWRKATLASNVTSYQITGLRHSQSYQFIVEAINANSATATLTAPLTIPYNPPATPTGLATTARSTTEVLLTWASTPSATGYRIYRGGTGISSLSLLGIVGTDQTSFNITGLSPSTGYYFAVQAFNDDGTGFAWAPFVTTLTEPPTAPGNFVATVLSPTSLRLTWTDSLRENYYEIQQGPDGKFVRWCFPNSTSRDLWDLTPGATYQLRVVAKNNNGGSAASDWFTIRMPNPPAGASSLQAYATSSSTAQLTWVDGQAETEYRVYRQNVSDRTLIATLPADTNSYSVTGLTSSTAYQFSIEAFNTEGTKSSSFRSFRTLIAPPTAPTNFVAVATSATQARLTWTDSVGETFYRVERITNGTTTVTPLFSSGSTAYTATGLLANCEYQFRIVAGNSGGTAASGWLTVRTPEAPPSGPGGLRTINVGQTFAVLSWIDVAQETGYRLYQTTAGVERIVATLAANTTQFTVDGLLKGTGYRFRVAAFNSGGEANSALLDVTTLAELPPPIRNFTAVAVGPGDVQLTWSDTTGEARYSVYQAVGTTPRTRLTDLAANSTSFRVTGLSSLTTYSFQIVASNSGGSIQTSWVTVTTL